MSPDTIGEPEPAPASEQAPRPATEPATEPAPDAAPDAAPEPLAPILAVIIGAIAAMIGLLPWLATGMRLPLQNLWATQTSPDEMPFTLLPYSQYTVMLIASVLIVGAGLAGLTARILGSRVNRRAAAFLALGVLIVHIAAITQTTITVSLGLQEGRWAAFYLTALVLVATFSMLVGVGILFLIARAPVAGAAIGLSIVAVLLGVWLGSLTSGVSVLFAASLWAPAVLIGLIIAFTGFRTIGRGIAVFVSLLILHIGPALITAVSSAAGTRALARNPGELIEHGVRVFLTMIDPQYSLGPLLVAFITGVAGAIVLTLVPRGTKSQSSDTAELA